MNKRLFLTFALISLLPFWGKSLTLSTVPTFTGGNGSTGVCFNVTATKAVTITSLTNAFAAGAHDVSIWYKTLPINGTPGAINALNGWIQVGTNVAMTGSSVGLTAAVATNQQIPIVMNVAIPAGQTYGFCIISSNTVIYTTYAATMPATVSNSDIIINVGPNVG